MTYALKSLVPVCLTLGLIADPSTLLGAPFHGLYRLLGPVGYAILIIVFMLYVKIDYDHKDLGNRWFLVPLFFVLLGILHTISLGGILGEATYSFFLAFFGNTFNGISVLLVSGVFLGFLDHVVRSDENLVLNILTKAKAISEEGPAQSEPKNFPVFPTRTIPEPRPVRASFYPEVTLDEKPKPKSRPKVYALPSISVLNPPKAITADESEILSRGDELIKTLEEFKIQSYVESSIVGPTVTTFKLATEAGTRYSKIVNLRREIMGALKSTSVRIVAPIPGTNLIGIEVPNKKRLPVSISEAISSIPKSASPTTVSIGKSNSGEYINADLAKMPHTIVAGTTGSGKSVGLQAMIASLLMRNTPDTVRIVLIDPKQSEFAVYEGLPHLWSPVVYNDLGKAQKLIDGLVDEMEKRYSLMAGKGFKDIKSYNASSNQSLPYILLFIEEFADLKMSSGKKGQSPFETQLCRIAQKARAAGIHAVIATQRPSVDVVSGLIKSNFPSAIAYSVRSQVDSKVILDDSGAEALIGQGDLLYKPVSAVGPMRVQGAFVSEKELKDIVAHYRRLR